jgi:hypothetical protein
MGCTLAEGVSKLGAEEFIWAQKKEITGDWRNLHNKMALFTKYHREIKSGMTEVGHVAHMERREIHSVLKDKSRAAHLENQDVDWKIVSTNRTGDVD